MSHAVWGCRDQLGRADARPVPSSAVGRTLSRATAGAIALAAMIFTGCTAAPRVLPMAERHSIDRQLVEYPANRDFQRYIENLTGPSAIAFDDQGSILIAEGGTEGDRVQIYGFRPNGTRFDIYPHDKKLPGPFAVLNRTKFHMFGPVGGMAFYKGKVYVSHRDDDRMGRITAFDYNGNHTTIIAGLPAQGDYGVTDLAIDDRGRLFFGVGSATNSGVVGLDNLNWARNSDIHDEPYMDLVLRGLRFDTPNPFGGLFGGAELAVTAPFQSFNVSNQIRIHRARDGKPNSAIYSIPAVGGGPGDLTVFATGIRMPRGLAFNEFWRLYATNNGMELRGTRPVKDDPDVLLRVIKGFDGHWPDYTANLLPVDSNALQRMIDQGSNEGPRDRFQPPPDMISGRSYPEIASVVDWDASGVLPPDRDAVLQSTFSSQSGAAKMDFVPAKSAFSEWRGNVVIALSGDRAPFATSGRKLVGPIGYKVMRVDVDTKQARELIRNTNGEPRHMHYRAPVELLERPFDVKFGPDGAMYILDMGQMEMRGGREVFVAGTGQIFRLLPTAPVPPATQPIK